MRVVPYIIPPGKKLRRYQTKTKASRIFRPGETVYLIIERDKYFPRAYAVQASAWKFIAFMERQPGGINRLAADFKDEIPTKVI